MSEEIVDLEAYHEELVEKLESMREFRATEAANDSGDERVAHAAEVLRAAVHEIDALPVHDARLQALALASQSRDDQRRSRYIEQEDHIIGRHGMGEGATHSTDELLAALMSATDAAAG